MSFQHSGQRAPQYLTSQNGTNPETTAHADEYEEGYVPEDATSEEHWKEDEWVGDEEHKEWDEHDLENKHFDPEKVCTLGDPNQCTSWGDDCCGSMEWDEPQTCAEGYYPVDMGNCIYRCIPNECGEWVPEEEEESDKPVMDYEMPFYETEFMIWHKHWKSMSLDPMGVWIMPSKGSTSDNEGVFAIGWMYSDNIDGTGIW